MSRIACGLKLGLSKAAATRLSKPRTPEGIQDFVNSLPWNFEFGGWSALSVAGVLEHNHAHCIEGALIAAYLFWINGQSPLLMDMGAAKGDDDHVVALFRRGRYWGAISKSNTPFLRYRDPIYRSLRELTLSYFPHYIKHRRKTLRTYSIPFDLRRHDSNLWVTRAGFCQEIVTGLTASRHYAIVPPDMKTRLRPLDGIEAQASLLKQCVSVRGKSVLQWP